MSDTVPLLPNDNEQGSSPLSLRSKLRARITGSNNSCPSNDCNEVHLHKRENSYSSQEKPRCCKKTASTQRKPAKYSIAFIASTWGFLTNVERAIILPTMWLYLKTWGPQTANKFYGPTLGVFSLSILIATPLFGYAGYAKINVKYLLLLANFLEIVGNLFYLCAYHPWLVFVGRMIAGLGASCESPMYADLTRSTDFNERTPYIIVLLLTRQIGLIFGPAFTLILDNLDMKVFKLTISVYNGPGLVMACLWLIHSILIIMFYPNLDKSGAFADDVDKTPNVPAVESPPVRPSQESRFGGFKQFHFFTLYATTFASYYCTMALESVLPPLANRAFGWSAVQVSYVYIGASILIILVSVLMHLMSKRIEDRKLILMGVCILISSYLFLAVIVNTLDHFCVSTGSILIVIGVAVHVIGMPFPLAISESLYTKLVPPQHLDKAQTILRTVINVAYLIGPFVAGSLHNQPTTVFLSMLFINLIPMVMFLFQFSSFQVSPETQTENTGVAPAKQSETHLSV